MFEPSGQAAGLASKIAARHAFWIVVSRDGQRDRQHQLGFGDVRLAGREVTLTVKLAPLALLALPLVLAVSFGWNGSAAQLATWKLRRSRIASRPGRPSGCPSICHRAAVGGVELEFLVAGAFDGHVDVLQLQRNAPAAAVGSGSLLIVSAAVLRSTLIVERTTTVPRLNGGATAGAHDRQAERRALVGAGDEDLAFGRREWVRARGRR